jgi:uncharacterized protein (TIGR02265 family)
MESAKRASLIDELCRASDLAERLPLVPPSARVRGLYFGNIERAVTVAGHGEEFSSLFPKRFATVLWHPATEFLVQLAVGGALLAGPDRLHEGMFELGRGNAVAFGESLLGRTLLRLLARDPKRLLRQGIAARRQSCSFGRWELEFSSEREAIVTMAEEYLYIDSFLVGAAQGTFDAIGITVRTEIVLRDRFNGQHILRW